MTDRLRILHLEDSSNDAELVRAELARAGIAAEWRRVETRDAFIAALDRGACSLILADYHLPAFDGLSALAIAHEKCPEVPFIFVSGAIEEQLAIEALTGGATDYVYKSRLSRLAPVVRRALEEARLRRERSEYEQALQQLVDSTSILTGHAFIRVLVRDLAAILHTQYAFIGLIADKETTRIRTVALWTGGDYAENFEYALAGTPCENVVGKSECFYPSDVQQLFPQDHLLAEMNLHSYHGVPLFRSDGTPLGLLSVFDKNPMESLVHLRPLVRVFANRAASELERLEAEQKLREGERRLATLMDNLPGMAYRCRNDPRWTMEFVSGGCEALTGYAPEDLIMNRTVSYGDITVPEDRQMIWDRIQHAVAAKTHFVLEYRITTAAGAVKWVWEQGCGVYGENGDLLALEGLINDITERKRVEAEQSRLAAIVENSNDAIMTRTPDGIITSWNAGAERMLGYSAAEAIGKPAAFVLLPDRQHIVEDNTARVLRGEVIPSHETKRVTKDGRIIDVLSSHSPIRDESGKIIGGSVILNDISELKRAEATRAQLAAIVEHSDDAIISRSPDGTLLSWNAGAEKIFGYSAAEMIGNSISLLAPQKSKHESQNNTAMLLRGEPVPPFETVRLAKDGHPVEVQISVSAIRDAAGKLTAIASIFRDITERKRSEASRAQLAAIVEGSYDAIVSRDLSRTVLTWNAAAERLFGYTAAEVIGRDISFLIPPDREQEAARNRALLAQGHAVLDLETVRLAKDGRAIDVSLSQSPIMDERGTVTGVSLIFRDIRERKQAAADRARLAAIIEGSEDTIFSRTLDGIITSWNAAAARMFGYAASEAIGKRVEDLILPPEVRARVANNVDRIRHGARVAPYETRRMTQDGRMIDVLSSVSPIRNDAGEIIGASVILHDISALKQAEAAVRDKERLFRSTIEHAEIGITHLSLDGHYLLVNPKFCDMTGFTEQELRPKSITELIYHEDLAGYRADRQQLLANLSKSAASERRYQRKDGALIWVHCTLSLIRTSEGDLQHLLHIVEDITPRKQAEAAIRESEERFHAAFEQAGVGMGLRDIDPLKPRWLRVNQKLCDILGYTREKRYVRKDGRIIWANLSMSAVYSPEGRPTHIVSVIEDITDSKLAAQALKDSEEQFRQLATNIPEVFWIIDGATGAVTYVSPAFEMIWGRACEEFRANPAVWTDAIHPDDREHLSMDGGVITRSGKKKDYRIVRPDGAIRWIHDQSFPVMENGRLQRIICIAEDITERKENEARLLHLAHYDGLTDLPNRVLFRDRLQQALVQAQRNDWLIGVLIIGIDRFKNINDTYGHETGDKVLREAGLRIAACTRLGDTTGRLGGDEFGIILSNLGADEDASLVAQKIMSSVASPVKIDDNEIFLSVSVGISLYPADSQDTDALIRDASAAVRRAKELGRNNVQFHKTEMNARAKIKLGLETSLRRALDNSEFLLHYQPKVALLAGEICGFEALLRWQRPDQGMVSPADFVPLLEETGLILPVGDWVLRTACAQARHWRDSGLGAVPIAVNLSVRQFLQPDLDQHLLKIINESGIEPDLLELEITESFLMHNPEEAAQTLTRLRNAGIRISVDDFGTGYSSLSYLSRFPIDSVKIDRSFIRDVTQNPENAAIARAVIGLARNLGMKSVAEGVETETQLGFLSANDCDEMQGYFFSRPLPAAECTRMLEEGRRLTSHIRSQQPERFTVLLVDDEENVLEALERVLRRDGYRILTAKSAAAGLDLLATHEIGVVISDERMPDMSGVAFLSRVCKMYPDTIRMVLTGYADMQAIISAINDGAIFKFLQKPWDNTALRASVREAFRLYELKRPHAVREAGDNRI